jgi:hypothetical protein
MVRQTRRASHRAKRQTLRLPRLISTSSSLQGWYKYLFEKLGWIVEAKAMGRTGKVAEYKRSIRRFLETVKHVHDEYEGHNNKHDLNVIRMKVEVLQAYVEKHL